MFALALTVVLTPIGIRFGQASGNINLLRAVALLATLVNVFWVPAQFQVGRHVQNVVTFFLLGWLATFKTIGCAFGRGPLCSEQLTLLGTYITYALPINPVMWEGTGIPQRKKKSTATYAWDAVRHLLVLVCGTSLSHRLQWLPYGPTGAVHMLTSDLVDAINLYAFIAVIMNVASIATIQAGERLLGFSEIMVHCDRPWLATSFGEFWSRRWNVNTGHTLRYLIYDPICEGSMVNKYRSTNGRRSERRRCSDARRAVALVSAFAMSGAVHECFIYLLRGVQSGSGRWFLFFFLQAPMIMMVDPWLKRLRSRTGVWVPRAVTFGLQMLLAHTLFFMPVVELGITDDIHGGVNHGIRMLLSESLCAVLYPVQTSSSGKTKTF